MRAFLPFAAACASVVASGSAEGELAPYAKVPATRPQALNAEELVPYDKAPYASRPRALNAVPGTMSTFFYKWEIDVTLYDGGCDGWQLLTATQDSNDDGTPICTVFSFTGPQGVTLYGALELECDGSNIGGLIFTTNGCIDGYAVPVFTSVNQCVQAPNTANAPLYAVATCTKSYFPSYYAIIISGSVIGAVFVAIIIYGVVKKKRAEKTRLPPAAALGYGAGAAAAQPLPGGVPEWGNGGRTPAPVTMQLSPAPVVINPAAGYTQP